MELTFDKGRGYVPAERNKQAIIEKNDINTLPVDSIYTPVLKVNYNVESTRVGQAIDYDKLTIEVWTDGTINAQEAVSLAARVLTARPPPPVPPPFPAGRWHRSWWKRPTTTRKRLWR